MYVKNLRNQRHWKKKAWFLIHQISSNLWTRIKLINNLTEITSSKAIHFLLICINTTFWVSCSDIIEITRLILRTKDLMASITSSREKEELPKIKDNPATLRNGGVLSEKEEVDHHLPTIITTQMMTILTVEKWCLYLISETNIQKNENLGKNTILDKIINGEK